MNSDNVIEVRQVWKSFKTVQAVKGVNLSIPKGQFVALLGSNGAGKTTLVEMIEGIQKPDKGEILLMGKKWKDNEAELRMIIGLSLQETRFIDKLRVIETLRLFASFFNLGEKRVKEMLELTGLGEKQKSYVVNLSGGQRQRLALGISLINSPQILLLDEPTTGLDPNARREIWAILHDLKNRSETSIILTTHYMEEAENLCDYIIIMDHGTILREGSLAQLLEDEIDEKVIEFKTGNGRFSKEIQTKELPFNVKYDIEEEKGFMMLKDFEKEMPEFLAFLKANNVSLKHFEYRRKTLDDLFTSLTGRKINE
jgi:ABC-2 type transport system ATP-binding protein